MHQVAASLATPRPRRPNVPARGPAPRHNGLVRTRRFLPPNGLNQLTSIGGTTVTHDARGNVTLDPTTGNWLVYESQNELKGGMGFGIGYDALLRPIDTNVNGAGWKQFLYDGIQIAAELQPGQGITGRYVWGDGPDELLVDYVGSGTTNRRWAHADERGSVIALSDGTGNATINRYDEYGKPQASNSGRFQYTGQMWLPELSIYHYKARAYSPTMGGRFYQTDPIGYQAGPSLYPYVGNDPVNWIDPLGLCGDDGSPSYPGEDCSDIIVTATRQNNICDSISWLCGGGTLGYLSGGYTGPGGGGGDGSSQNEQCPAVPSPGLGQAELNRRANASAARAANRNRDFFSIPSADNRIELFLKSLPGARNDTKSYVRRSDEYGNFLFGAEAAAGGLSLQEALNWGANAQVVQDLKNLQTPSGSDNPGDAAAIQRGYQYYSSGCSR